MPAKEILIRAATFSYRVLIENGSLAAIGKAMRLLFPASKTLLVSDNNVYNLYGNDVEQALAAEKWQVETALFKPGEGSKSLKTVSLLYDTALAAGLHRNSPLIALGGGVTGDLAGFAAATFLRGVPLVMVPTSLLAQVDSSVGGKVGVNHHRGKNLVGAVYPPRLVLIDPLVLQTLTARHLKNGFAEVIKYAIIGNREFFQWLEERAEKILSGDATFLAEAVVRSVQEKQKVVEADEFEKDYRRVLNFGHTIGHALEAATTYRYYMHGEAVLAGMAMATDLAVHLSHLDSSNADRIKGLLRRVGIKKAPPGLTAESVIDKLMQDKKRSEKDIVFVLPKGIGKTALVTVNSLQPIRMLLNRYLSS